MLLCNKAVHVTIISPPLASKTVLLAINIETCALALHSFRQLDIMNGYPVIKMGN